MRRVSDGALVRERLSAVACPRPVGEPEGRGRRGARRLAAILLAGAALLAGAGGARAQTVIWEAEMVADAYGTNLCVGYRHDPSAGSLSSRTVSYKDYSYEISHICRTTTHFEIRFANGDARDMFGSDVSFDFDGTAYGSDAYSAGSKLFSISFSLPEVLADSTYTLKITTTEPGPPRNLTATSLSAGSIRLNWAAPSSIGGSAIAGYDYRTSTDGGETWGAWIAIANSASLTTVEVAGLAASAGYTVQVRAKNDSGAGLYSDEATTSACGTLPEVTTHENGSETIYGGCLLVAEQTGGTSFGYNLLAGKGSLLPNTFAAGTETVQINSLFHGNSKLFFFAYGIGDYSDFSALGTNEELEKRLVLHLDGHTFPFSDGNVTACCPDWPRGTLSWSVGDTVVVRLDRLNEPSAPQTLTASAESSTQVTLSWSAPARDGGADVTGYEYRTSTDGGTSFGDWTAIDNSAGLTSYVAGGLTASTAYTFELRAVNSVGGGTPSATATATTTSARASAAQTVIWEAEMVADSFATSRVGYRHDPSAGSLTERHCHLQGLHLHNQRISTRGSFGRSNSTVADVGVVSAIYNAKDLFTSNVSLDFDGTTFGSGGYHAQLTEAHSSFGWPSPEILADSTYTLKITTSEPGAPLNLTATTLSAGSIRLNWAAPSSIGGSAITGYDYRISTDGGVTWGDWIAIANSAEPDEPSRWRDSTASAGYTVQMRAKNDSGAGLYSDTAEASTTTVLRNAARGDHPRERFRDHLRWLPAGGISAATAGRYPLRSSGTGVAVRIGRPGAEHVRRGDRDGPDHRVGTRRPSAACSCLLPLR